jgi:hypothetical protein
LGCVLFFSEGVADIPSSKVLLDLLFYGGIAAGISCLVRLYVALDRDASLTTNFERVSRALSCSPGQLAHSRWSFTSAEPEARIDSKPCQIINRPQGSSFFSARMRL